MRPICLILITFPSFAQQPREILERVKQALGDPGNRILHMQDTDGVEQDYQSSPPFITMFQAHESWTDPRTGNERVATEALGLGGPRASRGTTISTTDGNYFVRDTAITRLPGVPGPNRRLNLWAVLAGWRAATDLRLGTTESFAGYPRTVLLHRGEFGDEKLFIDPKSDLPVKLDREESHYLWGQVHVEYDFIYWQRVDGVMVPISCARVVDGFKEIARSVGKVEWIDPAAGPSLAVPDTPAPAGDGTATFLQTGGVRRVDAVDHVFLSVNPGYTEAITRIGDTVYILDATQGEARARQDLAMIEQTFGPGHKYVVVVTDLAWPHLAGVRFWVAQGATVVSHRESKAFLERVIARKWTRTPDLLEQRRATAKLNFVAVDKSLDLAGGALKLFAIDGIGSEGALMAWIPATRFLWASDYIQTTRTATPYTLEVFAAVRRVGIAPETVVAQHIPLTPWTTIEKLCQ
jgi:hypothetical protein